MDTSSAPSATAAATEAGRRLCSWRDAARPARRARNAACDERAAALEAAMCAQEQARESSTQKEEFSRPAYRARRRAAGAPEPPPRGSEIVEKNSPSLI